MTNTYKSLSEAITDVIINGTATKYEPTVIPDGVEPFRFLMNKAKGELLEVEKANKKIHEDFLRRFYDVFWGVNITGYAANGKTCYPKKWYKDGNI